MATRTIPAPSNPYASGAVVFDSTPYTEYYIREQQKEQAKEEALDRYYEEEISKISPAGMRADDLPVFNQKFNELKKTWVENKDAIKNPTKYGFDKAQQYNQLKADLMSLPIESKEEKEKDAFVLKLLADPTKRELIDIPALSESMRMQKTPIRTQGRKSIDIANLPFLAKEYTPQEKQNYYKSILSLSGKEGVFGEPVKEGRFSKKVTYTEQYSDNNLKKMGDIARADALSNERLKRTVKSDFEQISPEIKIELNNLHQSLYGRPIQGAEDLAAAAVVRMGRLAKSESEKRIADEEAKFDESQARADRRAAIRAANSINGQYSPEAHVAAIFNDGDTESIKLVTIEGKKVEGRRVSLPDEIAEKYGRKVGSITQNPEYFYMSNDGKFVYPIFETGGTTKSGNKIIDTKFSERIPVSTGLVPQLGKVFGGTTFTRKNIFPNPSQSDKTQGSQKEVKETKIFIFPNGKKTF
jgi:hypothetical protein